VKNLKKFVPILLAVMLIAAVFVIPVFAQGEVPPAETAQDSVLQVVKAFFNLVIALFVIGIGSERGTQLVKVFWNLLADKLSPAFSLRDQRAFILAAVVAFFVTYFFGVDMTQFLRLFDGFDPDLLKNVNAMLLLFASTRIHDSGLISNSNGAAG
jgi:ABC-type amino acid transport substrate-binding protein